MKIKISVIIFFTACIIGITPLAFATERLNLLKAGTVSVEKSPSAYIRFYKIFIYQEGGMTVVKGRLKQRTQRHISPGFVKISLIEPDGNIQKEVITSHSPRHFRRHSRFGSKFEARLPYSAQQGSIVRLSFLKNL